MKRLLMALVGAFTLLGAPGAFAQISDIDGRWSFGGGFTSFSLTGLDAPQMKDLGFESSIPGFYFGASLDYAFSAIEGLNVEPGVYITHYGKPFKFGLAENHKSYHANYIYIPINLKYSIPLAGDAFGMALYTGPRFNLGMGGNMFSTGKTYPAIRPYDAQWGFGIGFMIQDAILIRGGYDLGVTNCLKTNKDLNFEDKVARRNALYVGASFLFR